jgi:F420-dependent oxidoreductase-like protein
LAPKIRIGIQTGLDNVAWPHLLDFWQFVDRETVFDNLWTYDHFVPPTSDPMGDTLEGWTALTALAQATERVRLGCLITGVTYRHPSVLAKMGATVDHVSNGRLEFGIGAAWHEGEHRAYGIEFPPPREREDRLEEAVQIIRLLFQSEGPVDFEGKYYHLSKAPFAPRCIQRPNPPIFVGGGGEKRTLRTAARYGDAINVMCALDAAQRKIEVLKKHCADAGRDPDEITKSVFGPLMLIDDPVRAEQMRKGFAGFGGGDPSRAEETLAIGDAAHVRGVLERFADAGVMYYVMMSRAPYKFEIYRRISDEIAAAFT